MNKEIFEPDLKDNIDDCIDKVEDYLKKLQMCKAEKERLKNNKEPEEEPEILLTRLIRDKLNADPRTGVELGVASGLSPANITNLRSGATIRISPRSNLKLANPLNYTVLQIDNSTGEVFFEMPKKEDNDEDEG